MTAIATPLAAAVIPQGKAVPANTLVMEVSQTPLSATVTTRGHRERTESTRGRNRVEHGKKYQGYVIQFESDLALVMLQDDEGAEHRYRFPADRLKESGIRVDNQPFELKETKIFKFGSQHPAYLTEFVAMAPAGSATIVQLDLDPEYEKKLKNIEAYFSESKNAAH